MYSLRQMLKWILQQTVCTPTPNPQLRTQFMRQRTRAERARDLTEREPAFNRYLCFSAQPSPRPLLLPLSSLLSPPDSLPPSDSSLTHFLNSVTDSSALRRRTNLSRRMLSRTQNGARCP